MFCPHCGNELKDKGKYCTHCGKEIPEDLASGAASVDEYYDESISDDQTSKKKILPIILIAAGALVVILAVLAVYFFVLKPAKDRKQVEVATTTTAAQTTTEETKETTKETTTEKETTTAATFPKTMYATAEGGLYIRTIPSTENNTPIHLIQYGREITVEKIEDDWAYTTVDGISGWCSCEYLTENASEIQEATKPQAGDPNTLVLPEHRIENGSHARVNASDGLALRYGPGVEYGQIDIIPNGTEIEEEGYTGTEWIYIKYNGHYGWVSVKHITFMGGIAKPAIYLYPESRLDVSVDVKLSEGEFTITAPEYKNGWRVTAYPDGGLVDKESGKEYDYIYWESDKVPEFDWSEGYVVEGKDTEEFLLDVLPRMGLIPAEYNEFINYWLPRMQSNKYNLVTFQTDCYTDLAELKVTPKPDSVLRVFMAYKAIDRPIEIKAPKIKPFERKGFTVVEWGGSDAGLTEDQ